MAAAAIALLLGASGLAVRAQEDFGRGTTVQELIHNGQSQYASARFSRARATALILIRHNAARAAGYSLLGWSEYQIGNYEESQRAFQNLLAIVPGSAEGRLGLALSDLRLGHAAAAEAEFIKIKAAGPNPLAHFAADGLGWIALLRGKDEEAAQYFNSEIESRRNSKYPHDGHLGLGWIALTRGEFEAAENHFKAGLAAHPNYFRLHEARARLALLSGKPDEAARIALEVIDKVRFNRDVYYLLDAALDQLADRPRAIGTYRKLVAEFPDIPEYHAALGAHELRAGNLLGAEAACEIALQLRPNEPSCLFSREQARKRMIAEVGEAWALYEKGEYEKALARFEARRSQIGDRNPAVHAGRGWAYLALAELREARSAFAAAVKVDARFTLARDGESAVQRGYEVPYLKGWDLVAGGYFARAQKQFDRAGTLMPRSERWRLEEAEAWIDLLQGRVARAERTFKFIVGERPKAHLSIKGLGYVAIERKDYSAALVLLQRAYGINAKQILPSYTVPADRLIEAGESASALTILDAGALAHPDDPTIEFLRARAHAELGNTELAAAWLIRAVGRAPIQLDAHAAKVRLPPSALADVNLALGHGLLAAGENDGAIRRFDEYLRGGGTDIAARRGRGLALYRLARYSEAIVELEQAAATDDGRVAPIQAVVHIPGTERPWPIAYDARSVLAWANFHAGDAKSAEQHFRIALSYYPASIDALTGMAYSLLAQGERAAALKAIRTALLISPGYPDAWRALKKTGENEYTGDSRP